MTRRQSARLSSAAEKPPTPSSVAIKVPQKKPVARGTKGTTKPRSPIVQISAAAKRKTPAQNSSDADSDEDAAGDDPSDAPSSEADAEASGYEDEDASVEPSTPSSAATSDSSSSATPRRARKKSRTTSKTNPTTITSAASGSKGHELWRAGVKTGLGPGTQVIIKKPQARSAGRTPYTDATIHPNTLLFLRDLAANNDREWLRMHDPDFRAAERDFRTFLAVLQERLVALDETIPELPLKDVVFRIYRDVRFSKDQTPYKTHFSAAWSRTGRKGPFAAYYVQVKAGGSFVGGGLWMPDAAGLARLRRDVDRRPERIKRVLMHEDVRRGFLGGGGGGVGKGGEKEVVERFLGHNAENALKTKPKGWEVDHRDIGLLRLRNYTLGKRLADEDVLGPEGLERVVEALRCLVPFVTYLNEVVMPDGPESSGEEDEDEEEGDERSDDGASDAAAAAADHDHDDDNDEQGEEQDEDEEQEG